MELIPITKRIPEKEPKLRIYNYYVVLNAAAVNLLGIENGDYVQFSHPLYGFRKETYIRKTKVAVGSYVARKRKGTMRVASVKLATLLRERLDGNGSYRICPEVTVEDKDGTYYSIFFKNYDKENSD